MDERDVRRLAESARLDALRDAFAREFGVRPCKWSDHNLARMLRLTGERSARIAEMRRLLDDLGMGCRGWIVTGGVFDHGEFWASDRIPRLIVGHPYDIGKDERSWLGDLSRFTTIRVSIDDRESYYGFGTHHVRIELTEVRRPFDVLPATRQTRAFARSARKALAEEWADDTLDS
jgi:hypothetical protein